MKLSEWFVILTGAVALSSGLPARIHVGGLFDEDELEIAFRTAVDMLNADKNLLNNSKVVVKVEKLYSEDIVKLTHLTCGLLQQNVSAIFVSQPDLSSEHVQSICDHLEVPYIESRLDHRSVRDLLSINLYPHSPMLYDVFVLLLDRWGWRDFFLVYEEDEAIVRMKDIIVEGRQKNWTVKLHQFKDHNCSSYRQTFSAIKRSTKGSAQRIVLDVPLNHLFDVMKSAQQVGMMTENQRYFITSLDLHTIDLDDFLHDNTGISGLRLVREQTPQFKEFLQGVNNRLTRRRGRPPLTTLKTETALIYDSVMHLAKGLEQMGFAKHVPFFPAVSCDQMNTGVDGTSLINFMKIVRTSGLSGRVGFDNGFRSVVSFDVMSSTSQGFTKIGNIVSGNEFNIIPVESSDFGDFKLDRPHYKSDPYTMISTTDYRYEGYCIDLMDALAEKLHFSYSITIVKDGRYGWFDPNTKTSDGMIGEVVRGEADIAIADMTILSDRILGVEFTSPFMQSGIGILFKKQTKQLTSIRTFLQPFSIEVWLLMIAACTIVILNFFLVGRMSPYERYKPHPCRQNDQAEKSSFSLPNSMWFIIGSLMQQGSEFAPKASSTRVLASMWYFFCLIMISSYTASLAALFAVEKSPIESLEDLAKQEKIKYGCIRHGYTQSLFKKSSVPTYQKIFKFMEEHKEEVYVNSNAEGIRKVLEGDYAFFMESTAIEYITERGCKLTQIGGLLYTTSFGIAVRKDDTEFRSWLSGGILKLQEEGTLQALKEKWWKHKSGNRCSNVYQSRRARELTLGNVGGVFIIMLQGLCLSACVLVIEFLWFQRRLPRDRDISLFRLLMEHIRWAFSCGSSTKPALKMHERGKRKDEEENPPVCSSHL